MGNNNSSYYSIYLRKTNGFEMPVLTEMKLVDVDFYTTEFPDKCSLLNDIRKNKPNIPINEKVRDIFIMKVIPQSRISFVSYDVGDVLYSDDSLILDPEEVKRRFLVMGHNPSCVLKFIDLYTKEAGKRHYIPYEQEVVEIMCQLAGFDKTSLSDEEKYLLYYGKYEKLVEKLFEHYPFYRFAYTIIKQIPKETYEPDITLLDVGEARTKKNNPDGSIKEGTH